MMRDTQLITIGVFTIVACAFIVTITMKMGASKERFEEQVAEPASIHFFADNKCSPACCTESNFSCSGGCVCLSEAQRMALSGRGNNGGVNVGRTDFYA